MSRIEPLVLAVLLLVGGPAYADDDEPSIDDVPHITIVGTAHTDVRPDLATITLGVTGERPTAKAAAAENAERARTVIEAAKMAGVPAIDIATQNVTLTQTFDPIKDTNGVEIGRKPRGFAAENVISIKVRDLGRAGGLAEELIGKGANRFDGIAFSVEHPEPVLEKLVGMAVRNARSQADTAAEAANVRIGRVLLIERPDETSGGGYRPFYRAKRVAAESASEMPLEAGTTFFSTSVSVTWALEPNKRDASQEAGRHSAWLGRKDGGRSARRRMMVLLSCSRRISMRSLRGGDLVRKRRQCVASWPEDATLFLARADMFQPPTVLTQFETFKIVSAVINFRVEAAICRRPKPRPS